MTGGFGFQSSWNVNQSDSENVMNAKRICLAMKGDIESQTHPTKSQVLQYLSALSVYYTSFNQLMKENNLVILAWKNKKWMTKNKQTKEGEWVKVEDLLQNRITWYKKQIRSAKNPKLWETRPNRQRKNRPKWIKLQTTTPEEKMKELYLGDFNKEDD